MSNELERVIPLYMDENIRIHPMEKLHRKTVKGKRIYKDFEGDVYLSTTSFIDQVLPESKYLTKWKVNLATDGINYEDEMNARATYGTAMHILIEHFCIKRTISIKDIKSVLGGKSPDFTTTDIEIESLYKDVAAFAQFIFDYNVIIHFIELPIKSSYLSLAGSIDIGCTLDFNKSRHRAIIDIKSGRKGFFDSHILQLEIYKRMYNSSFYGRVFPMEMIFNWAPNDWRKDPSYKLKNQTGSRFEHLIDNFVEIGRANDIFPKKETEEIEVQPLVFGEKPILKTIKKKLL